MMDEKKFLEKFIDMADIEDEITMDTILDELEEWDSLSIVSFIAFAKANGAANITATKVREAKTVHELYDIVKK